MDKLQCPMCESQDTEMIDTYTSEGYTFYQCIRCEGIFADPMKGVGKEWYESSEWYSIPSEIPESIKWYEQVFLDDPSNYKTKRVLNVGCGRNIFLKRLKELNCEVTAIDINENIIEFTRNVLGIESAYVSDIIDFARDYNGKKFDVIIFFEVLEHLEDPGEIIRCIKKILEDDGFIVVSVPNRERILPSKDIWDYPPHHLSRWNIKSLKNFLEINGYLVDKIIMCPHSAEDLLSTFGIFFGTKYLEEKIKKGYKRLLIIFVFKILFKFRVIFYNILAIILRLFIKTKGLNIYSVAKVKDK